MTLFGTIGRLQVQRRSLTIGTGPTRYFDPAGLLGVSELVLTPGGAMAALPDGSCLVDVHHAAHPFSRSRGENTLSFGFARHYDAMRLRFGERFASGCAAENIVIDGSAPRIHPADVSGGIVIETDAGSVALADIVVAAPCLPFAKFALGDRDASTAAVKAALQFLDHGMRGFYCRFTGPATAVIRSGARVFAI